MADLVSPYRMPLKVHELVGEELKLVQNGWMVQAGHRLHVQHIGFGKVLNYSAATRINFEAESGGIKCCLMLESDNTVICTRYFDAEGRSYA